MALCRDDEKGPRHPVTNYESFLKLENRGDSKAMASCNGLESPVSTRTELNLPVEFVSFNDVQGNSSPS